MKNMIITELVKFETKPEVTTEQLFSETDKINDFLKKQDGFIDYELIKSIKSNECYLIYHIENMEKLRVAGEKIRNIKLFDVLLPLIQVGSLSFTFYYQQKKF